MFGLIRRLLKSQSGSNLAYTATIIIPLIGAVGIGTDAGRSFMVKAKLSQALDSAALAGAKVVHDDDMLNQDVNQFFKSNFPNGYMDATVTGPTIEVDDQQEIVTLRASATVPTTFMRIFGIYQVTVSAETEVTRKTQYLDLVLSIDMSGSMSWGAPGGGTRIQAARAAAVELVNVLYGDLETKELLKIGIVPWNAKVNVTQNGVAYSPGSSQWTTVDSFKNPLTGSMQNQVYQPNNTVIPLLSQPPANWKGCVYARYRNNGVVDDGDTSVGDVTHTNGDWVAWEPIGNEGEPQSPGKCSAVPWWSGSECTPCLSHGIVPLTQSKAASMASINALISPTGSTNIAQGLVWAWRVLVPAAPFTQAEPDPDGPRTQAILLLTDGEHVAAYGDGYKRTWGGGSSGQTQMNARLLEIAGNIKAQGILVYAIQFANGGGDLETLMKQVASEPNAPYYHYAPDANALKTIFTEVANHLSKLRISK
jgi:Flp pilus assembly protein TadG